MTLLGTAYLNLAAGWRWFGYGAWIVNAYLVWVGYLWVADHP